MPQAAGTLPFRHDSGARAHRHVEQSDEQGDPANHSDDCEDDEDEPEDRCLPWFDDSETVRSTIGVPSVARTSGKGPVGLWEFSPSRREPRVADRQRDWKVMGNETHTGTDSPSLRAGLKR